MLALFHLRLEQMAPGYAKLGAGVLFDIAEHVPVPGVVVLDQLETPAAGDDVASDQGLLDVGGERGMSGRAQMATAVIASPACP